MEEIDLMSKPKLFGHGCILSALGAGFEPRLFLERSIFPPEIVLGCGKMGMPGSLRSETAEKVGEEAAAFFDAKYLALKVSDSGDNAIQYAAAIEFLKRYREEILRLSRFPNVEQVNLRCAAAGAAFARSLPAELVELAAACGLTTIM